MIVCYAEGDGLGHLDRLRAYLHTMGLDGRSVTVLTGSAHARDSRVRGDWRVLPVRKLADLAPDELIVDAFPAGLRGELTDVPSNARVTHLARLLRWDVYEHLLPDHPPRFDRTYVLEELDPGHLAYLRAQSTEVTELNLVDPPGKAVEFDGWVIVHSGPEEEITELIGYARDVAALEGADPGFTLVCPAESCPSPLPEGVVHRDLYPVSPAANFEGMIFTGAGFNSVRRFAPWRALGKHRVLPFPRTLDDQFARAARIRAEARTPRRSRRPV